MIEIKDKKMCSGCHACYNKCPKNAIEMVEDEKGFKYPQVDKEKCVNCGLCDKVCPILNKKVIKNSPEVYACYNKDEDIRLKSSSGGIFTLIAAEILNRKGIVFGAAFTNDFTLSHQYIDNVNDLEKIRTSKYFQSSINDSYKKAKEFLDEDRYVLYTGTPCQIEGLLSYLGKEYEKLYTHDIICHGVPSPKVWKQYMKFRNKNDKSYPIKINFRDKKQEGWKLFSLSFKYRESEYAKNQRDDLFMKVFLRDLCLRDSCYNCSFRKKNRLSDITLADFWGIQNILPEMDDDKGTSLVLINSKKGKELYDLILPKLKSVEVSMEDALKSNPALIKSPEMNRYRESFFSELGELEFDELVKKYTPEISVFRKCIRKCKKVIKKIIKK